MKKLQFIKVVIVCAAAPVLAFSPTVHAQVLPESSLAALKVGDLDSIKEGATRRLLQAAMKSPVI